MKITNELGLPSAIVEAVKNDPYTPGESDITVTQLLDPPQINHLKRVHAEEMTEDAADRIWSLIGQVAHGILERADVSALTENRLYASFDGWKVGGQYDRMVLLPDGMLQDYKLSSVWEYILGLKEERKQQLNLLAWLARRNGYTINALEIVMIFRDWAITKAAREHNYPERQVKRIAVPLWSNEACESFLRERLLDQREALVEGSPRPCTADERWARSDKWAIMKKGRKSAVKLHDSQGDAEKHLASLDANHYIEHRRGESVRCTHYCPVADFCQQWKELQG